MHLWVALFSFGQCCHDVQAQYPTPPTCCAIDEMQPARPNALHFATPRLNFVPYKTAPLLGTLQNSDIPEE